MMLASAVSRWLSRDGSSVGPGGGSVFVSSCSAVVAHQPTVDLADCTELNGILTTSSIGAGHDQCAPGPSNAASPSPTGLPKRSFTARSCGPTVKKPDAKKRTTRTIMSTFTITKLLLKASDSAGEPA